MSTNSKHAFVLAGGGSLGAVQAGMLAELIASGVRPDLIVGVSAGALNGAFLAYEPTTTMLARVTDLWCKVRTRDILPVSLASLLGLMGWRGHIADPRGIRQLLERELPFRQFRATQVPLHIVAAEQATGIEVLLSAGDVIEAVLASTAIPGVFPAVMLGGRSLVDGAVATGTPISTAIRLGCTRLTIVPCGFTCVETAIPKHAIGRAMHAITLLGARQLRVDFAQYSQRAQLCLVPPLCPMTCSSYDYSHGATLIAAARQSTRQWIEAGGLEKRDFPGALIPHLH
jgi:NTE family protein